MKNETTNHRTTPAHPEKGSRTAGDRILKYPYPVEHSGSSDGGSGKRRGGKSDRKRIPGPSEHVIQTHCVRWFRHKYPYIASLLFAIPNGGHRNKATAGRLKAEGVKAGVADLFLSVPAKGKHGLYIEMKTDKGRQTDDQIFFEQNVFAMGYEYRVCRSVEDFMEAVKQYLKH